MAGACGPPAPTLVRRPAAPPLALLIADVSVLDVERGTLTPHQDVVVERDRITAITPAGASRPPAGAQRIAGEGATLLPGLIDMHGHVGGSPAPVWEQAFPDPDANMRAFLYCGVTSVLDPADMVNEAFVRRERIRRGELLGPTIYAAGPMVTAPGGHPVAMLRDTVPWWLRWYLVPRLTIQVASPGEAAQAVSELVALQPDVVKLTVDRIPGDVPRLANDTLAAAVAAARRGKVRAVAHIGSTQDALDAARAGVAAWMHGVYKERIADEQIRTLAGFRIPMVATTVVFESYVLLGRGPRTPTPLETETVRPELLRAFDHVPEGFTSPLVSVVEAMRPLRPAWRDNVRRLHTAGVTILAGSDVQTGVFPGAGLHRELHLLAESGLTPAQAIRAATSDAARFIAGAAEPDRGLVAPGKRADLLLVDGDPTTDLDALARIRAVILGGVVLERIPVGREAVS